MTLQLAMSAAARLALFNRAASILITVSSVHIHSRASNWSVTATRHSPQCCLLENSFQPPATWSTTVFSFSNVSTQNSSMENHCQLLFRSKWWYHLKVSSLMEFFPPAPIFHSAQPIRLQPAPVATPPAAHHHDTITCRAPTGFEGPGFELSPNCYCAMCH